jgi:UDP-N-acetyl-D-galactosamine dehydrogenase
LDVPTNDYDAVIIAVNHHDYTKMNESEITKFMKDDRGILIDIKGIFRNDIKNLTYWSF